MCRQTRIIVRFLDQILRARALIVEPHQPIDGILFARDEGAITVLWRVEQLVLFGLIHLLRWGLLLVAQSDEPIGFPPALRLITELALPVSTGTRRPLRVRRFQLLDPTQ